VLLFLSGSYLGWVISQVATLASLTLGSLCSKWCGFLSFHKHLFIPFLLLFSFKLRLPFPFLLYHLLLFNFSLLVCFLVGSFVLIFAPLCIIHTIYLCFSLCPSEVNLHTYLTTWLCSCLVGIFLGFPP